MLYNAYEVLKQSVRKRSHTPLVEMLYNAYEVLKHCDNYGDK